MRRGPSYTLGSIALGFFTFAAIPADAQTTASGPYYATPSWDQTLPASTRFIVLSNMNSEAVLDRETGLVWQRTPTASTALGDLGFAVFECYVARTGGRAGWRLPTPEEFMSLVDFGQSNPALPQGHPFLQVSTASYWTASTVFPATSTTPGLGVVFDVGLGSVGSTATNTHRGIWCVRGGSHVLTDFVSQP